MEYPERTIGERIAAVVMVIAAIGFGFVYATFSDDLFAQSREEAKQQCQKDLDGYSTMEQCVTENTVINENVTLYDGISPD
jgi:hypothetical protein